MKVLSIDGGGIRGLIPALVLAEIEDRTGKRIHELFDLIAGTSTGGILACALARPGAKTARELADLYVKEGPRIFHSGFLKTVFSGGGLLDERYEDDGLVAALEGYLGDVKLSDATVDVMCTAYEITSREAFFFRSARARTDATYDFLLRDAARATAAAPTYFEPAHPTDLAGAHTYTLVDGGVYANNPAMCALTDVRRAGHELTVLASLGTGRHTKPYAYEDARWWGALGWARPVIDVVFDGIANTTEFELQTLLGEHYVRLQCELTLAKDAMDDASTTNLEHLAEQALGLINDNTETIDRLCDSLGGQV